MTWRYVSLHSPSGSGRAQYVPNRFVSEGKTTSLPFHCLVHDESLENAVGSRLGRTAQLMLYAPPRA